MLLYHATWTKLVPRIRKQGLRLLQTSNWTDGHGARYGGGAIFAFASRMDAIRWGTKMDWEYNRSMGTGKVSILAIEDAGEWDDDLADTLSRNMSEDRWLKAFHPVPATGIVAIEPVTQELVKALMAHQNSMYQEAK